MGRNVVDRLKDGGVDAKKGTQVFTSVTDIWAPPVGHPLGHPRFVDPPEPEMWLDIAVRGVEKTVVVRDDGLDGDDKRRLLLVDGGRRTSNALWACQMLLKYPFATTVGELARAAGVDLPAKMDASWPLLKLSEGRLFVPVEFYTGSDADVLLERLRQNADPLKKADRPGVLAVTVVQLHRAGCTDPRVIATVMPAGIGPAEVEALSRWDNLVPEAQARFEAGAPLGLLAAVLDAARENQVAKLDELIAAGVTSTKGATRHENKKRAERAADRGEVMARKLSPKRLASLAQAVKLPDEEVDRAQAALGALGETEGMEVLHALMLDGIHKGIRIALGEKGVRLPKPVAHLIKKSLDGGGGKASK